MDTKREDADLPQSNAHDGVKTKQGEENGLERWAMKRRKPNPEIRRVKLSKREREEETTY